jgi:hypothetical protein
MVDLSVGPVPYRTGIRIHTEINIGRNRIPESYGTQRKEHHTSQYSIKRLSLLGSSCWIYVVPFVLWGIPNINIIDIPTSQRISGT